MDKSDIIEHGCKYPYDYRDLPVTPTRKAVLGILSDLTGRKGVGNELDELDDDLRVEITDSLAGIVDTAFKHTYSVSPRSQEDTRPDTPSWQLARDLFGAMVDDLNINLLKYADHVPDNTLDLLHAVLVKNIGNALEPRGVVTDASKNSDVWKMANDLFTSAMLNMPNEVYGLVDEQRSEDITESIYWTLLQHLGKGPYTPATVKQLNNLHSIAVTDDVGYSVAYAPTVQQFTVQTMGQTLSHNTSTSDSLFDAVKQASGKLG